MDNQYRIMPTQRSAIPQPVGHIATVCSLQILSKMNNNDWNRFRALVITLAAEHLDLYERFELQDPERVRLFYRTFHSEWPEIRKKYENSWVLVRYIKIYLKNTHKKRTRNSHTTSTQTRTPSSSYTRSPSKTLVSSQVSNPSASEQRPGVLTSSALSTRPPSHPAVVIPQHGRKPYLPDQVSPSVLQFLQSTKLSLERLAPGFLAAGIYDQRHLEDFVTWPAKSQSDFLLKTMGGKVNALELGALLIALENRRPRTTHL